MVLVVLCTLNTQVNMVIIGDVCDPQDQATCTNTLPNSKCDLAQNKCFCNIGFLGSIGDTVCKARIGLTCTPNTGTECDSLDYGECDPSTSQCACLLGYTGMFGSSTCVRSVRIGEGCPTSAIETDCLKIPNAECTDDVCRCKYGFGGVVGSTLCTPEATVRCTKSGAEMIMEIRATKDSNHQQIAAAKGTGGLLTSSGCKTSTFSTNKEFLELTIKVNMDTGEQTSPVKTDSDCFVTKEQVQSTTLYHTLVVGQGDADWVKGTDKFYKVECDSNSANGEEVVLKDVGITSAINPTDKTSKLDDVTLQLVKADDDSALTPPISLIEEVKLKITLYRKAIVTEPLGLFLHDLHVSDLADLTDSNVNKLKMLNADGCVEDVAAFKPESTFEPVDNSIVAASATKYEALTGKFSLALFAGMTELKLFFSVEYEASCFVNTEDKCFDLQQYCTDNTPPPSSSRRRRSVTEVRNGTATLSISVYLGEPSAANQDGVVNDRQTKDECLTSQYFWVVAVVLGCLTLSALLFAVFLFRRLKLEQRRSDKLDEKLGFRNPAF